MTNSDANFKLLYSAKTRVNENVLPFEFENSPMPIFFKFNLLGVSLKMTNLSYVLSWEEYNLL